MQKYLGLNIKRLNRRSFFWTIIVSAVLFLSIGLLVDWSFRMIFSFQTADGGPTLLLVPFMVLWWVYAASCAVRRLHDIDVRGWWSLVIFVPIASLLLLAQLFFFKGSPAENRYGEPNDRTFLLGLGL